MPEVGAPNMVSLPSSLLAPVTTATLQLFHYVSLLLFKVRNSEKSGADLATSSLCFPFCSLPF